MRSSTVEKIATFRSLLRGQEDVFPRRWENQKTGKAGYSPVCCNEWVPNVCGKPRVRWGECPNQAFVRFSDDVMRSHLTGKAADFTAGVYPMLPDETVWFLAADFDKRTGCRLSQRSAMPREQQAFSLPSNDHALAMVLTHGSSSASLCQRPGRGVLVPITPTMERCPRHWLRLL